MALDYFIIGKRIRTERENLHITQEALAEKLDVSIAYISRVECGTTKINLKRLSQICNALNVEEGKILNGTDGESANYLSDEFSNLLNNCSEDTQKLIYNISKLIVEHESKKHNDL